MTTQEKMHTIELSENELARVLFVMRYVNGEIYGEPITSLAFEKLGVRELGIDATNFKVMELVKVSNIPRKIDYYSIQKEWEAFLGIGGENKEILDKIANMERELAELKGML